METLLVFLAIIAIQMIAAYSKQKKEAAKRQQAPNLPPAEEVLEYPNWEEEDESEQELEPEPEPVFKLEGVAPASAPSPFQASVPFQAITDRKLAEIVREPESEVLLKANSLKIDASKLKHGIIWTAVLQEPRYKVKWAPRCSH